MSGIAQRDLDQMFWEKMVEGLIHVPMSETGPVEWARQVGEHADALLAERNKRFPVDAAAAELLDKMSQSILKDVAETVSMSPHKYQPSPNSPRCASCGFLKFNRAHI